MIKNLIKMNADDGAPVGGAPATFGVTDPMTGITYNVPKELDILIGHINSYNRHKGGEESKEELELTKKENESLKIKASELQKIVDSKDVGESEQIENLKRSFGEQIESLKKENEKIVDDSTGWRNKFESARITNDLHKSLSGFTLHNQDEVVELLMRKGEARLVEQVDLGTGKGIGKYETKLTLNLPGEDGQYKPMELTSKDAAEKFLTMPEHSHHVKSRLVPGGGSAAGETRTPGNDKWSQYDDAIEKGNMALAIQIKSEIGKEEQQRS